MYAQGTSTRDISAQLEELYGATVSASLISEAETVSEDVKAWQCRPLDGVYPILLRRRCANVYLDALYVNIKVSGRVSKQNFDICDRSFYMPKSILLEHPHGNLLNSEMLNQ